MSPGLFAMRSPAAAKELTIDGMVIQLVRKRVRYLNLAVYPPDGRVRVAAPIRASERDIRDFVLSRRTWIERQQARIQRLPSAAPIEYVTGEIHYFRGEPHRLEVVEAPVRRGKITRDPSLRTLQAVVPTGAARTDREKLFHKWHRDELNRLIPSVLARWEAVAGVEAHSWGVKRMKTKWGTCNTRARRIWISLELIKKSDACLDYIMIHELTHLHERGHGARFKSLMDRFMPDWRARREELRGSH